MVCEFLHSMSTLQLCEAADKEDAFIKLLFPRWLASDHPDEMFTVRMNGQYVQLYA